MLVLYVRGYQSPEGDSSMSMMNVPSLAPGARTLPGELRTPNGNAYGWNRLHQNLAPLTEPPTHIPVDPRIALSGLGEFCDDSGICYPDGGYVDPGTFDVGQIPTESPWPVVVTTQTPSGGQQSTSMTPAQLTALINAGSQSIQRILAITQGGTVLANGSIIGSQGAAQIAASQVPYGSLNVSGAGISGILSSPVVLLAGAALLAVVVLKGK